MTRAELTDEYARTVCKIGQGAACCRYLSLDAGGWNCERYGELAQLIDERVRAETIGARSINCDGVNE